MKLIFIYNKFSIANHFRQTIFGNPFSIIENITNIHLIVYKTKSNGDLDIGSSLPFVNSQTIVVALEIRLIIKHSYPYLIALQKPHFEKEFQNGFTLFR